MPKHPPYTQMTLKWLKKNGYECGIVEKWNQFSRRRIDLFNIIDIVAMKEGELVGVQSTSQGGKSSHYTTIIEEPRSRLWLSTGSKLLLLTWTKVLKKRGGKAKIWKANEYWITEEECICED